jgi:hypothetical protein
MNGVKESFLEVQRRRHVVGNTRGGIELGRTITRLPDTEKLDEEVVRESRVQHLADEENVGAQSGLQHNGHVGSVEKTDGVGSAHATLAGGLHGNLDAETLEVDNSGEDKKGRQEIHHVREVLAVKGLTQSSLFVGPGEQKVEESDDSTLEFRSTTGVDGRGGESLPDNRLANVGSNEERDTTAQAVTLLEQLVQKNDNKTSHNELNDQEHTNTGTEIARLAIQTSKDVHTSLTKGENDREKLLSGLIEFSVGLEVEVDVNEVSTSEELFAKSVLGGKSMR